tara:strand:- start:671 stop:1000 length:330 start_codon:yes stop_codon:yes gene_type:complete
MKVFSVTHYSRVDDYKRPETFVYQLGVFQTEETAYEAANGPYREYFEGLEDDLSEDELNEWADLRNNPDATAKEEYDFFQNTLGEWLEPEYIEDPVEEVLVMETELNES